MNINSVRLHHYYRAIAARHRIAVAKSKHDDQRCSRYTKSKHADEIRALTLELSFHEQAVDAFRGVLNTTVEEDMDAEHAERQRRYSNRPL